MAKIGGVVASAQPRSGVRSAPLGSPDQFLEALLRRLGQRRRGPQEHHPRLCPGKGRRQEPGRQVRIVAHQCPPVVDQLGPRDQRRRRAHRTGVGPPRHRPVALQEPLVPVGEHVDAPGGLQSGAGARQQLEVPRPQHHRVGDTQLAELLVYLVEPVVRGHPGRVVQGPERQPAQAGPQQPALVRVVERQGEGEQRPDPVPVV
ncbi:hypothetical protein EYA84_10025 [Verrucosispora sp. SN26_14.1]|nr:hypothetical protein EYA84_10025 [Verrucosispora sp. SN26_14.1]